MDDKMWAELVIYSEHLSPEQITTILGTGCDESWKIGDRRGRSIIIEKDNGWIIKSRLPDNAPINEHIDDLLARISPLIEKISMISNDARVQFGCVFYNYSDPNPGLHLDKEVINTLNKMAADLDIDLYMLSGED